MNTFIVVLQVNTTEDRFKFDNDWWKDAVFGQIPVAGEKVKVLSVTKLKLKAKNDSTTTDV